MTDTAFKNTPDVSGERSDTAKKRGFKWVRANPENWQCQRKEMADKRENLEKLTSLSFTASCTQQIRTTGCSIDPVPCALGTTISQENCKEKTTWEKKSKVQVKGRP